MDSVQATGVIVASVGVVGGAVSALVRYFVKSIVDEATDLLREYFDRKMESHIDRFHPTYYPRSDNRRGRHGYQFREDDHGQG